MRRLFPASLNVFREQATLVTLEFDATAASAPPALIQTTQAKVRLVRLCTIQAIRTLGPAAKEAVDCFIGSLADGDQEGRYLAARTFEQISEPARPAVPTLVQARHDEDRMVRSSALRALRKIDPEVAGHVASTEADHQR